MPVIYHHPKAALDRRDSQSVINSSLKPNSLVQSALLLSSQYGTTLDPKIVAVDALFALSEVFAFVAGAEQQFLNMIETLIKKEMLPESEQMEEALQNLSHMKMALEGHQDYIQDAIRCLKRGGDEKWPKAPSGPQADTSEKNPKGFMRRLRASSAPPSKAIKSLHCKLRGHHEQDNATRGSRWSQTGRANEAADSPCFLVSSRQSHDLILRNEFLTIRNWNARYVLGLCGLPSRHRYFLSAILLELGDECF